PLELDAKHFAPAGIVRVPHRYAASASHVNLLWFQFTVVRLQAAERRIRAWFRRAVESPSPGDCRTATFRRATSAACSAVVVAAVAVAAAASWLDRARLRRRSCPWSGRREIPTRCIFLFRCRS